MTTPHLQLAITELRKHLEQTHPQFKVPDIARYDLRAIHGLEGWKLVLEVDLEAPPDAPASELK